MKVKNAKKKAQAAKLNTRDNKITKTVDIGQPRISNVNPTNFQVNKPNYFNTIQGNQLHPMYIREPLERFNYRSNCASYPIPYSSYRHSNNICPGAVNPRAQVKFQLNPSPQYRLSQPRYYVQPNRLGLLCYSIPDYIN